MSGLANLLTIRGVPHSILSQDAGYPDSFYSVQVNARIGQEGFLQHISQFRNNHAVIRHIIYKVRKRS
jgi:hypothetical protein